MPVYGTDVELAIVMQNSWDTVGDITNSAQSIAVISETFNAQQPLMASEGLRGRVDRGDAYAGLKEVTGEIECEAVPKSIGHLLASAMLKLTSVTSSSLGTHTFVPRSAIQQPNSALKPMTLMKKHSQGAQNYYNLNATGFELSCAAGEFLKLKIPYIGGRNDNATVSITASYPSNDPFTFDQCSFSIGTTLASGRAAIDYIKSFTLTVDESLETKHTLGADCDQWPERVVRSGFRTGTLNCTLSFDSSSQYIAFRGGGATPPPLQRAVEINFSQPVEAQSGYPHQLKVELPNVKWETFEAPANTVGEIEVNLTGRIKYDVNSAEMLRVTLVDTNSTY